MPDTELKRGHGSPCLCGRTDVAKRPLAGKQRYPHKCPHGEWCVAGDNLLGVHANHPRCKKCAAALRERENR